MYEMRLVSSAGCKPRFGSNILRSLSSEAACALMNGTPRSEVARLVEGGVLNELSKEGLIDCDDQSVLRLKFPIISGSHHDHFPRSDEIVKSSSDLVLKNILSIKKYCEGIKNIARVKFEEISLFILSNVLFDEFQINNFENDVIGEDRPARRGGKYYLALMEKSSENEPLGIYGNKAAVNRTGVGVHLYGNVNPPSGKDLINLNEDQIKRWDKLHTIDAPTQRILVNNYVCNYINDSHVLDKWICDALIELGLMDHNYRPRVVVLINRDINALSKLANSYWLAFKPVLIDSVEYLKSYFNSSEWSRTNVSFSEWFIWWYHILYRDITDNLIENGAISTAEGRFVNYLTFHQSR